MINNHTSRGFWTVDTQETRGGTRQTPDSHCPSLHHSDTSVVLGSSQDARVAGRSQISAR